MNIFRSIMNIFKKKSTAAYDGAGHGKRLGNWYPSNSSINSLLASSLATLRTRSHDIVRKNPYALNAIEAIVSSCIGTGIKPTHKKLSFSGININKIVNGKIVAHGGAVNTFETSWENGLIKVAD